MTVLSKKELAGIYAEKQNMKKGEAERFLDTVFETLTEISVEYAAGFKLGDIGTLEVNVVAENEREYRNPQTGEQATKHTPKHYAPKLKVNKGKNALKAQLFNVPTE